MEFLFWLTIEAACLTLVMLGIWVICNLIGIDVLHSIALWLEGGSK